MCAPLQPWEIDGLYAFNDAVGRHRTLVQNLAHHEASVVRCNTGLCGCDICKLSYFDLLQQLDSSIWCCLIGQLHPQQGPKSTILTGATRRRVSPVAV